MRSVVAPLYMLGALVLSFAATLCATVLAFQGLGGEPGPPSSCPSADSQEERVACPLPPRPSWRR